ncbi:MAG: hypothetical protein QW764_03550 [Desulfurococcaceae archaeon]
MLFYEEEYRSDIEEAREKEEEMVVEEEEEGELVVEQLKLLVKVSRTWQQVLQGQESVDALKSLYKPAMKPVRVSTTAERKAETTRKKPQSKSRRRSKPS